MYNPADMTDCTYDDEGNQVIPAGLKRYTLSWINKVILFISTDEECWDPEVDFEGWGNGETYGFIFPEPWVMHANQGYEYLGHFSIRISDNEDPSYKPSSTDIQEFCKEYNRLKCEALNIPVLDKAEKMSPKKLQGIITQAGEREFLSVCFLNLPVDTPLWALPGLTRQELDSLWHTSPKSTWGYEWDFSVEGDAEIVEMEFSDFKLGSLIEWPDYCRPVITTVTKYHHMEYAAIEEHENTTEAQLIQEAPPNFLPGTLSGEIFTSVESAGATLQLIGFLDVEDQFEVLLREKSDEQPLLFPRPSVKGVQTVWSVKHGLDFKGALVFLDKGETANLCFSDLAEFKSSSFPASTALDLSACEVRDISVNNLEQVHFIDSGSSRISLNLDCGSYYTLALLERMPDSQKDYLKWLSEFYKSDDGNPYSKTEEMRWFDDMERAIKDFIWDQDAVKPEYLLRAILVIDSDLLPKIRDISPLPSDYDYRLLVSPSNYHSDIQDNLAAHNNGLLALREYLRKPAEKTRQEAISRLSLSQGKNPWESNLLLLHFGVEKPQGPTSQTSRVGSSIANQLGSL